MPIRFLIAVLLCSGAAFVLGWCMRDLSTKSGNDASVMRSTSGVPKEVPAVAPEGSSTGENASSATSLPSSSTFEDHSHEVEVWHNPYMPEGDSYPPGPSPDKSNPSVTVTVASTVRSGAPSVVEVTRSDGFCREYVRLACDPETKRIEARVESESDTSPAPPPAWEDVSGHVYASSLDWGDGSAVTLDYSLYGLRGGRRKCIHGRVFVDL